MSIKVATYSSFFLIPRKLRYFFYNHVKMFLYTETETSKFIKNKALAYYNLSASSQSSVNSSVCKSRK